MRHRSARPAARRWSLLPLTALAVAAAVPAEAQAPRRLAAATPAAAPARDPDVLSRVASEAMDRGRHVIVVNLDDNRLYFTKGRRVLWSAPVGTGTGLRLEAGRGRAWDFATPNGSFSVTFKQIEPDWIAPDWYFVENGLPVPPREHASRRFTRGLGAAAVYIGRGLAIHGTDRPELLGRAVSHGCIRLSNADALRLYHNVQVGTEVMIVGGENRRPSAPPPPAPARPRGRNGERVPPPRDAFTVRMEGLETPDLVDRLHDELSLARAGDENRWPQVASTLLLRGALEGDDDALDALYATVLSAPRGALRDELATFAADAYHQRPLRALEAMGRLERRDRDALAGMMVAATRGLYPGADDDARLPWPTRRVLRDVLEGGDQRRGWDALAAAESAVRGDPPRPAPAAPRARRSTRTASF